MQEISIGARLNIAILRSVEIQLVFGQRLELTLLPDCWPRPFRILSGLLRFLVDAHSGELIC